MRSTSALGLWGVLTILVAVWIVSPIHGLAWNLLLGVTAALLWTAAWRSIFKDWGHRHLGGFLVYVYLVVSKTYAWAHGKVVASEQLQEWQKQMSAPRPIAKRNLDVLATHPRLCKRTEVVLGYHNDRPVVVDLAFRHTLIGASTGGGKTHCILGMLVQLMSRPRPPEIYIIDLKRNPEDLLGKFGPLLRYVGHMDEALDLLRHLVVLMEERNARGVTDPPILVFADEIADMTKSLDRDYAIQSRVWLGRLAREARSANIGLIMATQHPRFDVLPKEITNNLLRKIMFAVDTMDQAKVILGFRPETALPVRPGDFLLKDGLGLKRGKTLLVRSEEVDELLARRFSHFDEPQLKLWREIALGLGVGDSVMGINKADELLRGQEDITQSFIRAGYRHLVHAGVLSPPESRGAPYRIAVPFVKGVRPIQDYMRRGKWGAEPAPFITQ